MPRIVRFQMDTKGRRRETNALLDVPPSCVFDCRLRYEAYCPHRHLCFVCDAPHDCERLCRLARGDGEAALAAVETLRPGLLLIDFDRTLCSTKSGASPLPPSSRCRGRGGKSGDGVVVGARFAHRIGPELRSAVVAQREYGEAYVVTRNSHGEEIRMFLRMHGMEDLAENVCVVQKKRKKEDFIRERFFVRRIKV